MRRVLALALVLMAVLAAPASSALDPGALVLREADLPDGFRSAPGQSGVRSNARREHDYPPALRPDFERFRRVTGYQAQYARSRPAATIVTGSDLFRRAADAKAFVRWSLQRAEKRTPRLKAAPISIGDQGWVSSTPFSSGGTTGQVISVNWRYGRVLATVLGLGVSRDLVVALARAQQRRISAALG